MKKDAHLSHVGSEIAGALTEFREALRAGERLDERFTTRAVKRDQRPKDAPPVDDSGW